VIKVKEDKEKFEVTLDVSQYKPEELKVSTVNNVLSIEGKHEEEVKLNLT
jgi:crystallin alpha B